MNQTEPLPVGDPTPSPERTAGSVGTFCMYRKTAGAKPAAEPLKQRVITVGSIQQEIARETIVPRKIRRAAAAARARQEATQAETAEAREQRRKDRKRQRAAKRKNRRG